MAPLLSVGIPAYDRPAGLERAVRSVLAQTLEDLEVVVSDDASPDPAVARAGERLAAADARVRFSRREANLGHVGNYRWVLGAARGEHFMWLSDDDWLDPEYAARCLAALRAGPGRRLVCGQGRYYASGRPFADENPIELTSRRPGARLLGYYARVNMNGPLFGVARRADLLETPFPDEVGGDWLLVAAQAARGQVLTLRDVHVHRSADGLGADRERLARSFGARGLRARWHHVWLAGRVWREIAGLRALPPSARVATATLAALLILARYPLVFVARAAGLGPLEDRVVAWARERRK
jgi:glycosyltransferase involved in cell wall biosynthesis